MKDKDVEIYQKKYRNVTIRVNPYTIEKMNLIQSKIILKIEDYYLASIPFSLSMDKAHLLLILSEKEKLFFQKYLNHLSSLYFAAKTQPNRPEINFFIMGSLVNIKNVRENINNAEFVYKNCPDFYSLILGKYLDNYFLMQKLYHAYKNKIIEITKENKKKINFYNIRIKITKAEINPSLVSFSTSQIIFLSPLNRFQVKEGEQLSATMFFENYNILVKGTIKKIEPFNKDHNKVYCDIEFSPEIVEIVLLYYPNK